jgi:hypothetical protein
MINILVTLFLFLVLKWVFLSVFVQKGERDRLEMTLVSPSEPGFFLVESHDGRGSSSWLGSQLQGLSGPHVGDVGD